MVGGLGKSKREEADDGPSERLLGCLDSNAKIAAKQQRPRIYQCPSSWHVSLSLSLCGCGCVGNGGETGMVVMKVSSKHSPTA